jgi:Myb/SANT-like DNA-binding domain
MEGNMPSGNMMQGAGSYGVLDMQASMQIPHHHQHHHLQQSNSNPSPNFSHPGLSTAGFVHQLAQIPESSDQHSGIPFMDYGKTGSAMDHSKTAVSDEDEAAGHTDEGTGLGTEKGGKKGAGTPWQRMKWTDAMVKLLITAVSYTGEDTSDCSGGTRRKFTVLQKKGKWKAISKVMGERGCYVSPQQCEDKFNDLNKRYKRLTDILGRGTSCKVVENPILLEQMDHLTDKIKDDVRKILSSKHLFYEEMCSYHNGNRINLPADPALQKALLLALRNREEMDLTKGGFSGEGYEEEQEQNINSEDDDLEETELHAYSHKRMREDNACCGNSSYVNSGSRGGRLDINQALFEGGTNCGNMGCGGIGEQLELEKKKLQLQAQSLELERQRFKWERFSKKKERELQRMKMQNERARLENERMALELKHRELDLDVQKRGSL